MPFPPWNASKRRPTTPFHPTFGSFRKIGATQLPRESSAEISFRLVFLDQKNMDLLKNPLKNNPQKTF